jgi:hypothetical protein
MSLFVTDVASTRGARTTRPVDVRRAGRALTALARA